MNRFLLFFLFILLTWSCNNEAIDQNPEEQTCDNGTFVGNVFLTTQQEVEDFGAMCYTKIEGSLFIGELSDSTNDINDLSSLINLTEVSIEFPEHRFGSIYLYAANLPSLEGLNNVEKAGRLIIRGCNSLTTLEGLNNLVQLTSDATCVRLIIEGNNSLVNLNGLNNLTKIGPGWLDYCPNVYGTYTFLLRANNQLENIDGLENLNYLYGGLKTYYINDMGPGVPTAGNINLTNFCGLYNLFSNGEFGSIYIAANAYNPTVQDIIDGNCSE